MVTNTVYVTDHLIPGNRYSSEGNTTRRELLSWKRAHDPELDVARTARAANSKIFFLETRSLRVQITRTYPLTFIRWSPSVYTVGGNSTQCNRRIIDRWRWTMHGEIEHKMSDAKAMSLIRRTPYVVNR